MNRDRKEKNPQGWGRESGSSLVMGRRCVQRLAVGDICRGRRAAGGTDLEQLRSRPYLSGDKQVISGGGPSGNERIGQLVSISDRLNLPGAIHPTLTVVPSPFSPSSKASSVLRIVQTRREIMPVERLLL